MIKKDFPILKKIAYLDNASTTQKPTVVINAIKKFYEESNANVHRGIYSLSQKSSQMYEEARLAIATFINADFDEIVFTRNTTESINLLSRTILPLCGKRKKIILTELEHHSNMIPWQEFARKNNFTIEYIKIKKDFSLDKSDFKKINSSVAIFAFTAVSNTFGSVIDVKKLCSIAKKNKVITVVDGAQLAPHKQIDVQDLDCDFLAFSSHKMLGPSGVGVLYGKRDLLKKLEIFNTGGSMIEQVTFEKATYLNPPLKFEAGTPNIEGAIGLATAIKYIEKLGFVAIEKKEKELMNYAISKLSKIKELDLYIPKDKSSIISFNIKNVHPHDVASLLDDSKVCVRAGHHCNMPLMNKLNLPGTVRASFYFYNDKQNIDKLIDGIKKIIKIFNKNK